MKRIIGLLMIVFIICSVCYAASAGLDISAKLNGQALTANPPENFDNPRFENANVGDIVLFQGTPTSSIKAIIYGVSEVDTNGNILNEGKLVMQKGSSYNYTIPSTYNNKYILITVFSTNVIDESFNNPDVDFYFDETNSSDARDYFFKVTTSSVVTVPDIVVSLDGSAITQHSLPIQGSEVIKIEASGASKIAYTLTKDGKQIASNQNASVPTTIDLYNNYYDIAYCKYVLTCKAFSSGSWGTEQTYTFSKISVDVSLNGQTLLSDNEDGYPGKVYDVKVGDKLELKGVPTEYVNMLNYYYYPIKESELNSQNPSPTSRSEIVEPDSIKKSSYSFTIPSNLSGKCFYLSLIGYVGQDVNNAIACWPRGYRFKVGSNTQTEILPDTPPTMEVIVKCNGKELIVDDEYFKSRTKPIPFNKVKAGDKITIEGNPSNLTTKIWYDYAEANSNGAYITFDGLQEYKGSKMTFTVPNVKYFVLLGCSVIGTQNGKEYGSPSKDYVFTTVEEVVEVKEKIIITLQNTGKNLEAKANVTNGTFKQFVYSWDDGTQNTSSNNPVTISYPTNVGKHKLKIYAVSQNGTKSDDYSYEYEVKEQPAVTGSVSATISGKNISETSNEPTTAKYGTEIAVVAEPEANFGRVQYKWDNENVQSLPSTKSIRVPRFDDNNVHKLTIDGLLTNLKVVSKEYYIRVPSEYKMELEIDSWMEENEDAEGLLVSLRSRSDLDKANMNFYMLNEEVIYLVDYKNAEKEIKDNVSVELKLPLAFEVVDSAGGIVDEGKKTITWIHDEGLKKNESDTRVVVIKYTSLSKSSNVSEIVYPKATIYKANKKQDVSSVINCIYEDDSTKFEDTHKPYMYGDEGTDTFRPNDGISRAEGALVLMRIFGVNYSNVKNITTKFSDIEETYLDAQKAITKATEYKVINGYPDGTYRPKDKMTRAEFMKIIAAYITEQAEVEGLELKEEDKLIVKYKVGSSKASWAVPYISLLARLNMTSVSTKEKDLRLDDEITRAEVAQLCNFYLFRAPVKVSINTTIDFKDVTSSHKLFGDILEATRKEHEYTVTDDGKEKIK